MCIAATALGAQGCLRHNSGGPEPRNGVVKTDSVKDTTSVGSSLLAAQEAELMDTTDFRRWGGKTKAQGSRCHLGFRLLSDQMPEVVFLRPYPTSHVSGSVRETHYTLGTKQGQKDVLVWTSEYSSPYEAHRYGLLGWVQQLQRVTTWEVGEARGLVLGDVNLLPAYETPDASRMVSFCRDNVFVTVRAIRSDRSVLELARRIDTLLAREPRALSRGVKEGPRIDKMTLDPEPVPLSQPVRLSVTASDRQPGLLQYLVVAEPTSVRLESLEQPSFVFRPERKGTHHLQVYVTNVAGVTAREEVTVTVQ